MSNDEARKRAQARYRDANEDLVIASRKLKQAEEVVKCAERDLLKIRAELESFAVKEAVNEGH